MTYERPAAPAGPRRRTGPMVKIRRPMPQYSAFIALDSGPGEYREVEELIDAPGPRAAAQQVIESDAVEPGSRPLILIIEEPAASVFTTDDDGQAITVAEDLRRAVSEERGRPVLHVLRAEDSDLIPVD